MRMRTGTKSGLEFLTERTEIINKKRREAAQKKESARLTENA